ncbi:CidA/LrgA family holin-like protein [Anaerobacillus alkaliphilus]|uniref:CidA/LrgA family holin-like protein n=1 Tax=Anaerobacillus alkaliphilus TaxID=1548597 RepID=A0A4Q0VQ52_9BACI|nr:CidA/LrgA family holin-like protein [Anaerobacillus alkaliphilus]RXI98632.1 CidA/LrgA family holin-like protein [Anaerobacillus alkaliphilus]
MKLFQIMVQIAVLYGFFLTGKWIQMVLGLMIPGSIIGMILFFIILLLGLFPTRWFENGSELMLSHMPFMFLPVTVGIVNYFSLFQGKGLLLVVVVLVSTMIVIASSAYIGQLMVEGKERQQ